VPAPAKQVGAGGVIVLVASILLLLVEAWGLINNINVFIRIGYWPFGSLLENPLFYLDHILIIGVSVVGIILWRNRKQALILIIAAAALILWIVGVFIYDIVGFLQYIGVDDLQPYLGAALPTIISQLLFGILLLIGAIVLKLSKPEAAPAYPAQPGMPGQPAPFGQPGSTPNANPLDAPSGGFAALGFFVPLVGLILFLMWKDGEFPRRARSAGKGALIGAIVAVVFGCLLGLLVSILPMMDLL
jgi:hypothetical protein